MALVIPQLTRVTLIGEQGEPIHVEGVVIAVTCRPLNHDDFRLAPFFTDAEGAAYVTRERCEIALSALQEPTHPEHAPIELCRPQVNVRVLHRDAVERLAASYTSLGLLGREDERFRDARDVVQRLWEAPNGKVLYVGSRSCHETTWDGSEDEVEVTLTVRRH